MGLVYLFYLINFREAENKRVRKLPRQCEDRTRGNQRNLQVRTIENFLDLYVDHNDIYAHRISIISMGYKDLK